MLASTHKNHEHEPPLKKRGERVRWSWNMAMPTDSRLSKFTGQHQLYCLVALGIILISGFVVFLGAQYYQFQNLRRYQDQLQQLMTQIEGEDVALRMAAQLGAATTDPSWELVHKEKEASQDRNIQKLISLHESVEQEVLKTELLACNIQLLKIENTALNMVNNGHNDFAEATKLLDSTGYQQKRDAFREAMQKMGKYIATYLQDQMLSVQNRTVDVSLCLLLLSFILLFPMMHALRLTKDMAREREVAEQQLGRLNSCFLSFESDSHVNIQSLVSLCGELLEADGVVYQRIEGEKVRAVASFGNKYWHPLESFEGSLTKYVLEVSKITPCYWDCSETLKKEHALLLEAGCRGHVAQAVRSGEETTIGALHVFYENPTRPSAQNLRFVTIVSSAIAPEERRLKMVETLQNSETNLQREREQLAVTLRSITDGVISTDLQNRVILMNRVAEELTGWTLDEVQGKDLNEVFSAPIFNDSESQGPLSNRKNAIHIQGATLRSRNGNNLFIEGSCAPILHYDDSVIGHLVVFSDQTEKQRLQAQVALSSKLQSIGQLAAGIAHEINTPMQFISDNTHFLDKSFGDMISLLSVYRELYEESRRSGQSGDLLKKIDEKASAVDAEYLVKEIPTAFIDTVSGIERVTKLVKAMKTFSHPSQGKMQLSDLNQSIEATVNVTRNEWKYVADLDMNLDAKLPMVPCLIDELNQVVLNMITNSVDSIRDVINQSEENKKGRISVTTRTEDHNVLIILSDTGTGMPEEVRKKIFDPFFTTKEPGKGTGQGLAISHDIIVNKHKGRIDVQSEPGKGTQFTIALPIHSEA